MGWQGKIQVSFVIGSDGSVKDIKIIQSSGFEILDKKTIETVKDTAPFPKPPVEAKLIIPVLYKLD
jgi:protein TonB